VAPDEAFPTEASGGRHDGDVSNPRKKSNWWGETERVMLPVAIFPKVTVGLTAARAFGALAMRADNKSGFVDSTFEQIADDAGMSRRRAAEGVATLISLGWIEQVRKGNSRVSSKYRLRSAPITVDSVENSTVNSDGIDTVNSAENDMANGVDVDTVQDAGQCRKQHFVVSKTTPPLVSPSSSPSTSLAKGETERPKTAGKNPYTDEFERAWNVYPKRNGNRAGKFPASQQWTKAVKDVAADTLMAAIQAYAKTCGDLPKDFERWLKHRMWEDFADAPSTNGHSASFDSLFAAADAKAAANLIRVPYADPSQHPADPTPRAHWLRARRLEWIEAHEQEIRAALTRRAS